MNFNPAYNEDFPRIRTQLIPKIKMTDSWTYHYTMFTLKKSNHNIQGPRNTDW